jgi:hypothetical protein
MAQPDTFTQILNFLIPIGVYVFIGYLFYRVPLFHEWIDKMIAWAQGRREIAAEKAAELGTSTMNTIQYE